MQHVDDRFYGQHADLDIFCCSRGMRGGDIVALQHIVFSLGLDDERLKRFTLISLVSLSQLIRECQCVASKSKNIPCLEILGFCVIGESLRSTSACA